MNRKMSSAIRNQTASSRELEQLFPNHAYNQFEIQCNPKTVAAFMTSKVEP